MHRALTVVTAAVFSILPAVCGAQALVVGQATTTAPAVIPLPLAGDCTVGQSNDLDSGAGLTDEFQLQGFCLPNPPGTAGDLKGFAFPLIACQSGGLNQVFLSFWQAEIGDNFFLYVWRDTAGRPNDACEATPYVALEQVNGKGAFFSTHSVCDGAVHVEAGERFYIGVVYRALNNVFGPDWTVGHNSTSGFIDRGYVNLSGNHGDWVDLAAHGFDHEWGVFVSISGDCGPTALQSESWGQIRAHWRTRR